MTDPANDIRDQAKRIIKDSGDVIRVITEGSVLDGSFVFTVIVSTEFAALRLFYAYRNNPEPCRVFESPNYNGWAFKTR